LINFLRLICNHGEQLLPSPALEAWEGRDPTSVDWNMIQACQTKCFMCGTNINIEDIDAASSSETKYLCQHSVCSTCASRSEDIHAREESLCPKCCKKGTAILKPAIVPTCMDAAIIPPSSKVEALLKNLRAEQANSWASHESRPAKRYISSSSQKPPPSGLSADLVLQRRFQLLDQNAGLGPNGSPSSWICISEIRWTHEP
jgi:hypothetical protein